MRRAGLVLWIAQGFGVGRLPKAPGTFGTVLGLGWLILLLVPGSWWALLAGVLAGLALSVWLCGRAEEILGKRDPGSVVLDEIAAMPVCFLPLLFSHWQIAGRLPQPAEFLSVKGASLTGLLFGLFRLFDIWKPWPVRQSQRLPGGWGVTVDDLLAALYAALLTVPLILW